MANYVEIDYDKYSSPSEIYAIAARSQYHSVTSEINAQSGTNTYKMHTPSGTVNTGNAWAGVDESRYGFNTNSHGRVNELWQQFWLYIPDDYELNDTDHRFWVSAISYSSGDGHSGGHETTGTNGWSVRLQLADRGGSGYNLVEYTYNMDDKIYNIHDAPITKGWNHFETHVKCNTISNGSANADGVAEVWVDGQLVFSNTSLRFTETDSNKIEYGGIAGYYGGGGAPKDVNLYYDAHKLAVGDGTGGGGGENTSGGSGMAIPYNKALTATNTSDTNSAIFHNSHETAANNTYEAGITYSSTANADMGLLFGAQNTGAPGDSYTGYLAMIDPDDGEIRLDRWSNGSQVASTPASVNIPTNEELTLTIDWRDSSNTDTTFSITDESGSTIGTVTFSDTTYDSGKMGVYRYHAGNDWYLDHYSHASGSGTEGTEEPEITTKTLEITNNTGNKIHYLITANGRIQPQNTGDTDKTFTNKATGVITSGTDSYDIKGQITNFQATQNPEITYNGEEMTVEELQQICQNNR